MVQVIDDRFYVCEECLMVIANGDYSILDAYSEEERDKRKQEIDQALDQIEGHVVPGEPEEVVEFSKMSCDCCGSRLFGSRHHCVVLSN